MTSLPMPSPAMRPTLLFSKSIHPLEVSTNSEEGRTDSEAADRHCCSLLLLVTDEKCLEICGSEDREDGGCESFRPPASVTAADDGSTPLTDILVHQSPRVTFFLFFRQVVVKFTAKSGYDSALAHISAFRIAVLPRLPRYIQPPKSLGPISELSALHAKRCDLFEHTKLALAYPGL